MVLAQLRMTGTGMTTCDFSACFQMCEGVPGAHAGACRRMRLSCQHLRLTSRIAVGQIVGNTCSCVLASASLL